MTCEQQHGLRPNSSSEVIRPQLIDAVNNGRINCLCASQKPRVSAVEATFVISALSSSKPCSRRISIDDTHQESILDRPLSSIIEINHPIVRGDGASDGYDYYIARTSAGFLWRIQPDGGSFDRASQEVGIDLHRLADNVKITRREIFSSRLSIDFYSAQGCQSHKLAPRRLAIVGQRVVRVRDLGLTVEPLRVNNWQRRS